ncbi:hypothetical protein HYT04_03030 [Candidatus Kaiserbacteria bacterium]|nr:hypothetical protein [Candidatus Kaiserbacteria bacterium]
MTERIGKGGQRELRLPPDFLTEEFVRRDIPLAGRIVRAPELEDGAEPLFVSATLFVRPKGGHGHRRHILFPPELVAEATQLARGERLSVLGEIHMWDEVLDTGEVRRHDEYRVTSIADRAPAAIATGAAPASAASQESGPARKPPWYR